MNKLKYIIAIIFIAFGVHSNAQTISDALRLSNGDHLGAARTMGVGGFSFGALGGDQGGIYYNPATLAKYYRSEFMIAPYLINNRTKSSFSAEYVKAASSQKIGAINMGLVIARKRDRPRWGTNNIAITLNRVQDFDQNFGFSGVSEGSIVQRFQERANTKHKDDLDGFEAGLAYEVGAIYDFEKDKIYESDLVDKQLIKKQQAVSSTGYKNEFAISWAADYNDKFSFGISLGIPVYKYSETKQYQENAIDNKSQFKQLNYNEKLSTEGSGINLKLGVIATPVRFLRLGLSIQSPTAYSLTDNYSTEMTYSFYQNDEVKEYSSTSKNGKFDYGFTSPWNTYASMALLLNRSKLKGFLSAGLKYSAYTSGFFNLTTNSSNAGDVALQDDLNKQIDFQLQNNLSFSLGSELAYGILRLRGGVQMNGSPYEVDKGKLSNDYSLGFGFRFDNSYVDFAYRNAARTYGYSPYQLISSEAQPLITNESRVNSYLVSFGFMFGGVK